MTTVNEKNMFLLLRGWFFNFKTHKWKYMDHHHHHSLRYLFSGPKLHDTMPLLKITTVQSILCHYWLYYVIIILAVNSKKSTKVSDVSTCRERGRLFIEYDAKNSNLCLDQKCNFFDLGPNCNFRLYRGSIFWCTTYLQI